MYLARGWRLMSVESRTASARRHMTQAITGGTPNMITITPRGLSWHRMGVLALATAAAAAAAATTSAGRAAASLTVGTHAMASTAATAPTYRVVKEGLTPADGARL